MGEINAPYWVFSQSGGTRRNPPNVDDDIEGVFMSAMNLLVPTSQKSEDLISIFSPGIRDFKP
jgi:hypothetical protein